MKGRTILAGIFLIPAIAAGYMTWLMWRAGEEGKWLFGVFFLFFLLLAVAPLAPKFRRKTQPEPPASTRFVPHWFMMLAMLVLVLALLAGVLGALLRH